VRSHTPKRPSSRFPSGLRAVKGVAARPASPASLTLNVVQWTQAVSTISAEFHTTSLLPRLQVQVPVPVVEDLAAPAPAPAPVPAPVLTAYGGTSGQGTHCC
jgi:hypothetical protein